jgi:hypothetical protein
VGDLIDVKSKRRTVELSPRERRLLLTYGYPFPAQEKTLRESKAVKGYHRVLIDAYCIEMMLTYG